jgi:O-antigen ligase
MFFSIVVLRLQNIFSFFIEGVLHKGLSFTGRTDIWDKAIAMILESPFLGYGIAQSGKVYRLSKHKYYHAHNAFLEVMVEGGVFALIAFLLMLERAGRQLLIYRRHPYACLLAAGLMSAAVMTTMEPFLDSNGLLIYALVFFSYHVGSLIAGKPVPAAGSH